MYGGVPDLDVSAAHSKRSPIWVTGSSELDHHEARNGTTDNTQCTVCKVLAAISERHDKGAVESRLRCMQRREGRLGPL